MRKIIFLLFIAFTINASAQTNDYLLASNGIGALKLGMTQPEVEKLLGKKLVLRNAASPDVYYLDTAKVTWKKMPADLYFERYYNDGDDSSFYMVLSGISTQSPLCKTAGGIGIGSDKLTIINKYEGNGVTIFPEFSDESYTTRSKTKATITVYFDEGDALFAFDMVNKKVVRIAVMRSYLEGD